MKLADKTATRGDVKRVFMKQFLDVEGLDGNHAGDRLGVGGLGSASAAGTYAEAENLPVGGHAKRVIDVVVSLLAIIATIPLMLLIAGMISWNGGSPIFAHERIGFGGRPFRCLKFRTMRRDADRVLKELLESDPEAKEAWLTHRKLRDDPRITPIGRFLRKSSLDELPQLFNILRGDMSCVGPRPVTADELEYYHGCVEDYAAARPGLTGLWQISGRSNVSMERRVRMDVEYVKTWSFAKDALILLRTPFELIRSKGSF